MVRQTQSDHILVNYSIAPGLYWHKELIHGVYDNAYCKVSKEFFLSIAVLSSLTFIGISPVAVCMNIFWVSVWIEGVVYSDSGVAQSDNVIIYRLSTDLHSKFGGYQILQCIVWKCPFKPSKGLPLYFFLFNSLIVPRRNKVAEGGYFPSHDIQYGWSWTIGWSGR